MMIFMVLGALDRIIGNRFGLGQEFEEGINAMGPLALAMVGVVSIAPVLADVLRPVVVPVYQALGADPSMFATTLLAIDMGGYPLAKELALTPEAGQYASIIHQDRPARRRPGPGRPPAGDHRGEAALLPGLRGHGRGAGGAAEPPGAPAGMERGTGRAVRRRPDVNHRGRPEQIQLLGTAPWRITRSRP
ncbi:MAG: hypothetical protein CWE10_11810 [Symbiobacterium thermophilum]|uniref:Uncharacterized protein n=1 Tax=Symbiobacterium thermophilum TaxID=2734 RepID=A0A953LEU4_SYMTR|nr:hypothetical protein [Symbiobacterium thermophilum]